MYFNKKTKVTHTHTHTHTHTEDSIEQWRFLHVCISYRVYVKCRWWEKVIENLTQNAHARAHTHTYMRGCIQKFPDSVDNETYAYNNKHSLRSNTKDYGGRTHRTNSQNSDKLHLVAESCIICSSHSRRPVRKLLDTLFYTLHSPFRIYYVDGKESTLHHRSMGLCHLFRKCSQTKFSAYFPVSPLYFIRRIVLW